MAHALRIRPVTTLALAETRARRLFALTKPRVVSLIVFTAVIGMFLAVPGIPPARAVLFGTLGIALVAGAAAAVNCLVEQNIDALMRRTQLAPAAAGGTDVPPDAAVRGCGWQHAGWRFCMRSSIR